MAKFTKSSMDTLDKVKGSEEAVLTASSRVGGAAMAFFPLIFLAWDYYNSGSFVHSCITCCRDFLWPAAVVVAKAMNASPYQMLATNVGGIAWTVYNCFFAEHDEPEAAAEEDKKDFTNPNTLRGKITAKRDSLRKKW